MSASTIVIIVLSVVCIIEFILLLKRGSALAEMEFIHELELKNMRTAVKQMDQIIKDLNKQISTHCPGCGKFISTAIGICSYCGTRTKEKAISESSQDQTT